MSDDLIAEGRARLAAATAGPWELAEEIDGVRSGRRTVITAGSFESGSRKRVVTVDQTRQHHEPAEPNIELIVWMQNNLSVILDELEEARAAYAKLHADTQEGWARIAARQQRDTQRIRDLEQQLASGGAS